MRSRGSVWIALVAVAALLVIGCDGGGGVFDPLTWIGNWAGEWDNQTFDSQGDTTAQIAADTVAQTMTMTLDVDGNALGGGDPGQVVLTGPYDADGVTVSQTSGFLGDLALTMNASNRITGNATNIPGGGVDRVVFNGARSGDTMTVGYTVYFTGGGTAVGTLTLTRQ